MTVRPPPFTSSSQIFNAACGPIVMSIPPKLSAAWFPETQRTTATAVGIIANNLGTAAGFFAPQLVTTPSQVPRILYASIIPSAAGHPLLTYPRPLLTYPRPRHSYVHCGLSAIALVAVVVYFPCNPPLPPSPAAALMANSGADGKSATIGAVLKEWRAVASNWNFVALAVVRQLSSCIVCAALPPLTPSP